MKTIITRSLFIIISIFFLFFIYLSTIGIKTNKLNNQISDQIKNLNKNFDIKLNDVSIVLDPFKFKFNLKTLGTNLSHNQKTIELESIKSAISIKSLINNQFALKELNISTKSVSIKNIVSFIQALNGDPKLYVVEKLIRKGFLIADIKLEFNSNGELKENFKIDGFLKDGRIKLPNKYDFKNINFVFDFKKDEINLNDLNFLFNDKKLNISNFKSKKVNESFLISGNLSNKKILLVENEIKDFLEIDDINFKINKINFSSENLFSFKLNQKFKIEDLEFNSKINIHDLFLKNDFNLNNIFKINDNDIQFSNHYLNLKYNEKDLIIDGKGNFLNQEDRIDYVVKKEGENTKFDITLKVAQNFFELDFLNYRKHESSTLIIDINGTKNKKNVLNLKKISLTENNNKIIIEDLLINNSMVQYLKKINLDYEDKENLKNNISIIKKNKIYKISGSSFNANKLIENLLKSNTKTKNFLNGKNRLEIDVNKTYLDKLNVINNLKGYLVLNGNDIFEANIESKFSKNEKVKFTIKTSAGEKITTLFSTKAKPLVNRYDFIKGFDDGSLDFYSIKKSNKTSSTLKIYDFKLKELPALTKILTLASLQGIADLLSGEGIRFNEFEMNFTNENKLMTIDEIYAIGPAISILMSGYIESDKLISLRGTLVPATTLNKTIGSIPILGDILVGKKTGEGVFGVSFKIKGPPGKLETTVNPIKTLTPRFITRTLEKIKKN